ncbi:MAG TPA: aspartate ammonia-lyase [Pseudomonas sp.]|nr:aspartate ammonia-lyase [Pseudomonas sp.]
MSSAASFRLEKDLLGSLEVPADAYYGIQTLRAVRNFHLSGVPLSHFPKLVVALAMVKQAAADANRELGHLSGAKHTAISQACAHLIRGEHHDQFVVDMIQGGAGTSTNMNANEVIANRANQILGYPLDSPDKPVHPNDHVNMGQSTNDTIPTAIRLGCLWRLDELTDQVYGLAAALRDKAVEFDDVVKSGRTHLQDAVPVRLGQEFGAYARAVERDAERIQRAAEGLRRLGIGGTATGSGLNAHPEYHARMVAKLSERTGLKLYESDDLFESMQSMADAVDFSAAMRTLAVTLDRVANDFRLLSSGPATGLDEIHLPAVQPGSSIMPGKVNPVIIESLLQVAVQVMANDQAVAIGGQAGNLELNVMLPVMAYNLLQSVELLTTGISNFTEKCLQGLDANEQRCRELVEKSLALCTPLAPEIGYDRAAHIAHLAYESGRTVQEVALELEVLPKEKLLKVLNAEEMTRPGVPDSKGS